MHEISPANNVYMIGKVHDESGRRKRLYAIGIWHSIAGGIELIRTKYLKLLRFLT
jgi:hypothetical protein